MMTRFLEKSFTFLKENQNDLNSIETLSSSKIQELISMSAEMKSDSILRDDPTFQSVTIKTLKDMVDQLSLINA